MEGGYTWKLTGKIVEGFFGKKLQVNLQFTGFTETKVTGCGADHTTPPQRSPGSIFSTEIILQDGAKASLKDLKEYDPIGEMKFVQGDLTLSFDSL